MLIEMGRWLELFGVGHVGTDIYRNELPPSPARAMALIRYGGVQPPMTHDFYTPAYEDSRVQCMTRAPSYASAQAYAKQAYDVFWQLKNITLGGVTFVQVIPQEPPFNGGEDAGGNNIVLFNLVVWSHDNGT